MVDEQRIDSESFDQEVPEESQPTQNEWRTNVISDVHAVNLRLKPSTDSRSLAILVEGVEVQVNKRIPTKGWRTVKVTVDDKVLDGYVMSRYLTVKKED